MLTPSSYLTRTMLPAWPGLPFRYLTDADGYDAMSEATSGLASLAKPGGAWRGHSCQSGAMAQWQPRAKANLSKA